MIEMRRRQLRFGDGLIAEEVSDLREDWMKHADEVLADEEIERIVPSPRDHAFGPDARGHDGGGFTTRPTALCLETGFGF